MTQVKAWKPATRIPPVELRLNRNSEKVNAPGIISNDHQRPITRDMATGEFMIQAEHCVACAPFEIPENNLIALDGHGATSIPRHRATGCPSFSEQPVLPNRTNFAFGAFESDQFILLLEQTDPAATAQAQETHLPSHLQRLIAAAFE